MAALSRSEIAYNQILQRLVNAVKKDIDEQLVPAILPSGYTKDEWGADIQVIVDRLLAKWTSTGFKKLAQRMASGFVRTTLSAIDREQKRSFGIDVLQNSPEIVANLQAAAIQNANLITSIPEQYLKNVSNSVFTNMRAGLLPREVAKQIEDEYGVTQRRARFIARDQTAKVNGELTKQRQIDAGYEYFQWMTSHDERVRHRHAEIARADVGYGPGIYLWSDLPTNDEGQPIQPGSDYQCFPGWSPVNIFCGAEKVFRHPFNGELTTFVMESGELIECTPHHPMLTAEGFVAADLLNVGDYLVNVPNQSFRTANGEAKSSQVVFGKLFESAKLLGVLGEPMRAFCGNFHGDVAHGEEIDVVSFDWELPREFDLASLKSCFELLFACADSTSTNSGCASISDIEECLQGLTSAPSGIVRSACKLLSILSAGFRHPDEHGFASVSRRYTDLAQSAGDSLSGNAEVFRKLFDARTSTKERFDLVKRYVLLVMRHSFGLGNLEAPGSKEFTQVVGVTSEFCASGKKGISLAYKRDRIIEKGVREFSGHVYNLQMSNGLFIAHNTGLSNCRCTAKPIRNSVIRRNQEEAARNQEQAA